MDNHHQQQENKPLRWRCQRGMLELDLLLIPFFEQHYAGLTEKQQLAFQRLLACDDPQLLAWLMAYETPDDRELLAIVQLILSKRRA